jgi:proteasome lid subunit RPN8/RPN11
MLKLTQTQCEKVIAQGLEGKPLEICGFLAGQSTPEGDVVIEVRPIESDDRSALTYSMNPLQQLRAEKELRQRGLEILGIYHTHPATQPYPSPTDVARAHWGDTDELMFPEYSYLIVSLRDPNAPEFRSFKIRGRNIPADIEEEVVLIEESR